MQTMIERGYEFAMGAIMKDFYQIISELKSDVDNIVLSIIGGENIGAKAIISNGEVIYETTNGAFSEELIEKVIENHLRGLIDSNDQIMYCETLGSDKKLVICGGGHISIPIIKISKLLGFHVTVIEDRIQYADNVRRTEADEVLCNDFCKALEQITGDLDTYYVIVTRGHRYDQECLEEIIQKKNAYIGMIGSKVRVKKVKESLLEKGFEQNRLDNLYSPIGLKIGAETPEEIAVSIMAEIIQVKNQLKGGSGYPKEIIKAILKEETKEIPKVLTTIVSRKGSAPREVGTKMLIFIDGTTIGTIGGGCVEADICNKARYQLMEEDKDPKLYRVDMTGRDAEEEGMVCGGIVEIFLETV